MMNMKKYVGISSVIALSLSLTACGPKESSNGASDSKQKELVVWEDKEKSEGIKDAVAQFEKSTAYLSKSLKSLTQSRSKTCGWMDRRERVGCVNDARRPNRDSGNGRFDQGIKGGQRDPIDLYGTCHEIAGDKRQGLRPAESGRNDDALL